MSLLMDALKRAEKARQAEAERARAEGREAETRELALDPIEEPAAEPERAAAGERAGGGGAAGTDTEDSLELTPEAVRREIEEMPDPDLGDSGERWQGPPGADARDGREREPSLSLEHGDIPLDETGATLPSMRAAQRSVQDYFDGTHSMSLSMEDVQEAIGSEPDTPRPDPEAGNSTMDNDTTARRRAQTVLDARAVAPSRTGRNVALAVLVLLLLGGAGTGAWLLQDRFLELIDGRPTLVAQAPPPAPAAATRAAEPAPGAAAGQPGEQVLAADEREALLRAAQLAREEERRLAAAAAAREQAARAAAQAAAQPARAEAEAPGAAGEAQARSEAQRSAGSQRASEVQQAAAPAAGAGERAGPDAAAATQQSTTTAAQRPPDVPDGAQPPDGPAAEIPLAEVLREAQGLPGPASGGLRITRRSRPNPTHSRLVQAYEAFQRGDDSRAMQLYARVLAREPRNRDALLGAAAVHMRGRDLTRAAGYYAELLRVSPRDPAALAGLIAIAPDLDPASGESRIKTLLAAHPDDANLHFTLGNLYAAQQRWPEAQQAYFEASRLDAGNPDYAFNLAVSLDRLSQRRAALEWYRRAGELARERPASFEAASASRRIAALERAS